MPSGFSATREFPRPRLNEDRSALLVDLTAGPPEQHRWDLPKIGKPRSPSRHPPPQLPPARPSVVRALCRVQSGRLYLDGALDVSIPMRGGDTRDVARCRRATAPQPESLSPPAAAAPVRARMGCDGGITVVRSTFLRTGSRGAYIAGLRGKPGWGWMAPGPGHDPDAGPSRRPPRKSRALRPAPRQTPRRPSKVCSCVGPVQPGRH